MAQSDKIMIRAGRKAARGLLNMLYPPTCPLCERLLPMFSGDADTDESGGICPECAKSLQPVGDIHCLKCGKELSDEKQQYCYDCKRLRHEFEQGAAAFVYSDAVKRSVYRFKYKGQREYAKWYGKMLALHCKRQIGLWQPEVIVPVPLHKSRYRKRGYNQAALMARELGGRLGIPVREDYLMRIRNTAPMKQLSENGRAKNLENAFFISDNSVKYKKVMLVDDIYTTGATMDACARALKLHGVLSVYCVSLCVGKGI